MLKNLPNNTINASSRGTTQLIQPRGICVARASLLTGWPSRRQGVILQPPILSPDFVATRKLSPREKYGLQKSSIGSPEDERPYRLLGLLEGKKLRKLVRQSSEQFYRQVLSSGLPYSPRRQLFSTSQDASPALRRTIICRISACTQWRGNLEHKVLPRFLALFDSDCIRFFFRHIVKVQPTQGTKVKASERRSFNLMVSAVCAAIQPKLMHTRPDALAAAMSALGDMHTPVPAGFLEAWEAASLPLLPRFSPMQMCQALQGLGELGHTPSEAWLDEMFRLTALAMINSRDHSFRHSPVGQHEQLGGQPGSSSRRGNRQLPLANDFAPVRSSRGRRSIDSEAEDERGSDDEYNHHYSAPLLSQLMSGMGLLQLQPDEDWMLYYCQAARAQLQLSADLSSSAPWKLGIKQGTGGNGAPLRGRDLGVLCFSLGSIGYIPDGDWVPWFFTISGTQLQAQLEAGIEHERQELSRMQWRWRPEARQGNRASASFTAAVHAAPKSKPRRPRLFFGPLDMCRMLQGCLMLETVPPLPWLRLFCLCFTGAASACGLQQLVAVVCAATELANLSQAQEAESAAAAALSASADSYGTSSKSNPRYADANDDNSVAAFVTAQVVENLLPVLQDRLPFMPPDAVLAVLAGLAKSKVAIDSGWLATLAVVLQAKLHIYSTTQLSALACVLQSTLSQDPGSYAARLDTIALSGQRKFVGESAGTKHPITQSQHTTVQHEEDQQHGTQQWYQEQNLTSQQHSQQRKGNARQHSSTPEVSRSVVMPITFVDALLREIAHRVQLGSAQPGGWSEVHSSAAHVPGDSGINSRDGRYGNNSSFNDYGVYRSSSSSSRNGSSSTDLPERPTDISHVECGILLPSQRYLAALLHDISRIDQVAAGLVTHLPPQSNTLCHGANSNAETPHPDLNEEAMYAGGAQFDGVVAAPSTPLLHCGLGEDEHRLGCGELLLLLRALHRLCPGVQRLLSLRRAVIWQIVDCGASMMLHERLAAGKEITTTACDSEDSEGSHNQMALQSELEWLSHCCVPS